jgi:LysR family transcriptional regulator, glycine cleavage system transcriptional activator
VESTPERTDNAQLPHEEVEPPVSSAYDRLPLNALRVFEAVAERLNFGEAAEALHVTPAAVSQQIKTLEDYLQTPLFRRSGRNVQLTPEGARLLPGVRRGLEQLETALHGLKQDRHTGSLNVTTTNSFLQKWLTPRLADLHARHPDIELRLHTSPELVDFTRSDFHLALRFGGGNYEGLYWEKLLAEWLVAVASPAVLSKYGPLPDKGDTTKYPLLHGDEIEWTTWFATGGTARPHRQRAFIDDSATLLSAVAEGLGFAVLRWSIAAGELQSGRVALASRRVVPSQWGHYFVCPETYASLPKVVALREWLKSQAREFSPPPESAATPLR